MLTGIFALWFFLTFASLVFIIYDLLLVTPAPWVMKIAWVLVVLYTGPLGLFIYLLSCREYIAGTHDKMVSALWKQAIGSEVHCLAGDATGIILAAIIISFFTVSGKWEMIIEYLAGFIVGLFIFQALFMKKMMGGNYLKALKKTFIPEWLSMNMIMAGMIPIMMISRYLDPNAADPASLSFWGSMSLASIIGGIFAYPINQWLVRHGLKHGMITGHQETSHDMSTHSSKVSRSKLIFMILLTLIALWLGSVIGLSYR